MSASYTVLFVVGLLVVFMIIRVPVAIALGASGLVGLLMLRGWSVSFSTLGEWPFNATARYSLVVIPLFILMGAAAQEAGLARRLFDVANRRLSAVPGGLALATLAACAGFAAVSGSSNATAATIGSTSITEMNRHNYDDRLSAGVVAAAGTLGVLIPPSVGLVLYAIITGERIGDLLLAGIVPGLLSAVLYGLVIIMIARARPGWVGRVQGAVTGRADASPALPEVSRVTDRRPGAGILPVVEVTILFVVVMGGIYTGTFTATEASAFGALAAICMLLLHSCGRREAGFLPRLVSTLHRSAQTTGFLFFIIVGGSLFTFFLVSAGVPSAFSEWAVRLPVPPLMIVAVLLLAMIPLGMFLDPISTMLIILPLAHPVVIEAGFSGVWFGILIIKAIEIGLITPPLGLNVFVVAGSAKLKMETVFRGSLLFLPIDILTLILLFFVPQLSLWLPGR